MYRIYENSGTSGNVLNTTDFNIKQDYLRKTNVI